MTDRRPCFSRPARRTRRRLDFSGRSRGNREPRASGAATDSIHWASSDSPPTAHHEAFVPLSDVLPRCAALVSHGGIGTLAQGLAAGVPQLTMPMGFDQPDNATRLERLGVGRWVVPSKFDGDRVAATLRVLLEDGRTTPAAASGRNESGRAMPSKKPAICSSSLHEPAKGSTLGIPPEPSAGGQYLLARFALPGPPCGAQ